MGGIDEILVQAGPGETRLALIADGRPVEFIIDRGDPRPGEVFLGRVRGVNRGLNAAFIEIGAALPGFLNPAGTVSEGQALLVQVTAAARGDKGAELTAAVSLAGRFLAYSPSRPGLSVSRRIADEAERNHLRCLLKPQLAAAEGVVLRTEAAGAEAAVLQAELTELRQIWQALQAAAGRAQPPACLRALPPLPRLLAAHSGLRRLVVDDAAALAEIRPLFAAAELDSDAFAHCDAGALLEEALTPRVPLPGGGGLIIEATAGLTVIDIDSGGGAPLEANLAAVPEIARQLRRRAVAGHILVDLIPLRDPQARGRLLAALRQAVAVDPTPTHVVGVTPLGMVEMTRERRGPTLAETLLEAVPLPARNAETRALEALRALVRESLARPAARLALALPPPVAAALRRRGEALQQAARRLGAPPRLVEDRTRQEAQVIEETR